MRILLVYPRTVQRRPPVAGWVPLGLSFVAATLRANGHVVSVFDRFACQARVGTDGDRIDAAMLAHVERFRPDLIGLNTVSPLIHDTVRCVALLRKTSSGRKAFSGLVVAGGHHATAMPELTLLRMPGLDGVVEGEGELATLKLADGSDPAGVPGVWWRQAGGRVVRTPPRQIENLDGLPFPALDLLDMAFYAAPSLVAGRAWYGSAVSMMTSRGCTRRCDFCCESLTYGKGVRFHSLDYVMGWLTQVLADFRPEVVYFHDNDFLADEERVRGFCERMLRSGLNRRVKWAVQAGVDRIKLETARLLAKAGCILVELGWSSRYSRSWTGSTRERPSS